VSDGGRYRVAVDIGGTNVIPRAELAAGYEISRLIKGGWQLAGDHGPVNQDEAPHDMAAFVEPRSTVPTSTRASKLLLGASVASIPVWPSGSGSIPNLFLTWGSSGTSIPPR
jgi:hypothetical protein